VSATQLAQFTAGPRLRKRSRTKTKLFACLPSLPAAGDDTSGLEPYSPVTSDVRGGGFGLALAKEQGGLAGRDEALG